ncbi:hypothetical protein RHGRI_019587 [Rhododendron griersonianum]|uniref:Ubiquitin-like protease family profile domain-containing protein n=1 Tax=Rhododendron griersonianum TaxID=479676 RepID=A0AAV6JGL4_9ERIC|nr:hypothetical protein RHGRI_019587 [Rhododendron griersonianum]
MQHSSVAAEAWKKMSDDERAPFLELGNEIKARTKKNVPKKKRRLRWYGFALLGVHMPVFRSRCSPKALVKQNGKLNEDQRFAVGRLGFGSMLTLQCQILKREFISKLVHHFNPTNKTLAFGRMKVYSITPDDVARALGLPLGTVPVPTKCEECHFEHIRAMFAETDEELKRGVTFGMMREVFQSGVADAKFQTSYVLFVLSALLCPTTKDVASTKFYPSVYDLNKISSYAWPQFVFDWLVKEITKFKNRDVMEVDKKKDAPGVSGCVLLLMLIYFDKEEMGMNVGRDGVPLIQSWTTNLIMERIAKEENLDLVDPISGQFPEPCLLHPEAKKAYHLLKKSFLEQLENIMIMDGALMATASQTTQQNQSKGKDVREMDSPFHDDSSPQIPSCSTCTPNKARKGVAIHEMQEERTTGFEDVHNARDMPFCTPEHTMDDVNMEEDVQVEEGVVVANQGRVDVEGEEVQVKVHVDEGVVEERALTRPSKKRGNRTVKASKSTRTPYVAEPEVKDSKFTKEECQLIQYVMKPYRKKEDMLGLVSMDGMMFKPSRSDLRNVFKERGRMSNLVMDSMIVWLMKEEKEKSPKQSGVPIPTRHMFSSTFVLFLPILLVTGDHWFCVVINLVDKRIDVLDSMKLKSDEKTVATADVVSALFSILKRTRKMEYPWNNWNVHHTDVPQQNNIFDCGFYTFRFMEHWTGGKMNTREVEVNMGIEMRKRLLVRFILSPHNKRRDDVLQMCA